MSYGTCGWCRAQYQLTAKGLVRVHKDRRTRPQHERETCPGSGLKPAAVVG